MVISTEIYTEAMDLFSNMNEQAFMKWSEGKQWYQYGFNSDITKAGGTNLELSADRKLSETYNINDVFSASCGPDMMDIKIENQAEASLCWLV